jgi:hypothetical protein
MRPDSIPSDSLTTEVTSASFERATPNLPPSSGFSGSVEETATYLDAWLAESPDAAAGISRVLGDIACSLGKTQVAR